MVRVVLGLDMAGRHPGAVLDRTDIPAAAALFVDWGSYWDSWQYPLPGEHCREEHRNSREGAAVVVVAAAGLAATAGCGCY